MAATTFPHGVPIPLTHDANCWDETLLRFVEAAESRRDHYLRLARRIAPSPEEAEDIVQDAMLRAFRSLPRFRGEAKISTWLQTIVHNSAIEWLRQQHGCRYVSIEHEEETGTPALDLPDPGLSPEEQLENSEIRQLLQSEIDRLCFNCRQAMHLCFIEGASQEEAAAALNVSVSAIKSRIFTAKRHLRKSFTRRGLMDEA